MSNQDPFFAIESEPCDIRAVATLTCLSHVLSRQSLIQSPYVTRDGIPSTAAAVKASTNRCPNGCLGPAKAC